MNDLRVMPGLPDPAELWDSNAWLSWTDPIRKSCFIAMVGFWFLKICSREKRVSSPLERSIWPMFVFVCFLRCSHLCVAGRVCRSRAVSLAGSLDNPLVLHHGLRASVSTAVLD